MKAFSKFLSFVLFTSGILTVTSSALAADVSMNVGYVSEYYYRGIYQKNSSGSAGIDVEAGGFYIGAWTADVGDGLEIDGYAGFGGEIEGFSYGVGFTGYYYTGDFDETYEEVNLSAGYGPVAVTYSIGEWDGDGGTDYDFLQIDIDLTEGFYATYGSFGDEFDGDYFELGYGTTVGVIDVGFAIIMPEDELEGTGDAANEALVFSLGYSW